MVFLARVDGPFRNFDDDEEEKRKVNGMFNGLLTAAIFFGGLGFVCGIVYPVFMVFMNKVVYKSKLPIREILKRI